MKIRTLTPNTILFGKMSWPLCHSKLSSNAPRSSQSLSDGTLLWSLSKKASSVAGRSFRCLDRVPQLTKSFQWLQKYLFLPVLSAGYGTHSWFVNKICSCRMLMCSISSNQVNEMTSLMVFSKIGRILSVNLLMLCQATCSLIASFWVVFFLL